MGYVQQVGGMHLTGMLSCFTHAYIIADQWGIQDFSGRGDSKDWGWGRQPILVNFSGKLHEN